MTQDAKEQPSIAERLRKAARPSLSKAEIKAQRVSFALGMKSEDGSMTRQEIETLVEQRY